MTNLLPRYSSKREATESNGLPSRPSNWTPCGILPCLGFAMFCLASAPAFSAVAPDLGEAFDYTVLGTNENPTVGTVTCTNTGPGSDIDGNVGSTFTSITNTECNITGDVDAPVDAQVVTDFNNAYAELDNQNPTCDGTIPTTSTTLPPGVYCSDAETTIGTGVTFTLDGDATDVWVFKVGTSGSGALTGTGFEVVMGGNAEACNVFWWTAGAASLTDSFFKGTILSGDAFTMTRGSFEGRGLATTDATVTDAGPMEFAGCAAPATITVEKDFSDDNPDPVSVELNCTSGTVEESPLEASEAEPAVFTIGGAGPDTTCTAMEDVPEGYSADQTDCVDVELDGSCTIFNTLIETDTITVNKDFSDDNPDPVQVDLECTSGTIETTPLTAAEGSPAVFLINDADPGATCTATEEVPEGYIPDESDCVGVEMNGECTIFNELIEADMITVHKDFSDNNPDPVVVDLECTSGTIEETPLEAAEGSPAVFTITDADPGASCTATEEVPEGYAEDQTECIDVELNGSCTIFNTLIAAPAPVSIPTMSSLSAMLLAAFLAIFGIAVILRQTGQAP